MKHFITSITFLSLIMALFPAGYVLAAQQSCPLSFGENDVRIDLNQDIIFANKSPRQMRTNVSDIPKGRFEVLVATYDHHTTKNEANQRNESVKIQFRDGTTLVDKTQLASTDIAKNKNWRNSQLGSVTLFDDVNNVLVRHAEADTQSTTNESVRAICIRLRPIFLINGTLEATCSPSKNTVAIDEEVTWNAHVAGGTENYTYIWGDGSMNETATDSYSTAGTNTQVVVVSDGSNTRTATCSVEVSDTTGGNNNGDDLTAQCNVSDTTVEEGDVVTFEAEAEGGDGDYSYDWDWDIDGSSMEERIRFNREGTYDVRLTVRDDEGNMAFDVCPAVRVSEENSSNSNDIDLQCRVSDTRINEGDVVEYEVEARNTNGNNPTDYEWDGDIDGDRETERVRYNRVGTKEVDVRVTLENGDVERVSCPNVRVNEYNHSNTGTNSSSNSGTTIFTNSGSSGHLASAGNIFSLFGGSSNSNQIQTYNGGNGNNIVASANYGQNAGVNSVLLSQVPYTGPADVLKVLGILVLLAGISLIGAYYLRKRRGVSIVSNRIEDFKKQNKLAGNIW